MKKQVMNFNQNDNGRERGVIKKNNLNIVLGGVIVFHVIAFIFVYKFYYTAGVNMYMKIAILTALLEGGVFIGIMENKLKAIMIKSFFLACVVGVMLVLAMPIILTAGPVMVAGMSAVVILGAFFGKLFLRAGIFTMVGLIKFIVVVMLIINIVIVGNVIVKIDSCKSNNCLEDKANRYKDEKFCIGITSTYDRESCYIRVLFDSEKENIKSERQCDIIDIGDDRNYCYIWVAKNTLEKDICKEIEIDEVIEECYEEVAKYKCYELPWGERGECLDELDDNKNKAGSTSLSKSQKVTKASSRKKIERLKMIAKNTVEYVERCDSKGGDIVDTVGKEDKYCFTCNPKDVFIRQTPENGFVPWSTLIDECGENRSARDWIVFRENGEWAYTIKCERYPECSGLDNLKCTKEGCVFSEKCK